MAASKVWSVAAVPAFLLQDTIRHVIANIEIKLHRVCRIASLPSLSGFASPMSNCSDASP
jgi:hypothetical protein